MLCVIFWVVLRRMNVISRRFGTLYPWPLTTLRALLLRTPTASYDIHYLLCGINPTPPPPSPQQYLSVRTYRNISIDHSRLTHSPMKMERIQSSETSANNVHTPENNPKDNAQHSDPGESLKFSIFLCFIKSFSSSFVLIRHN